MVIQERKLVTILEAEKIVAESKDKEEAIKRLRNLTARQKAPPAPEGGISLSAASRKYKIPHPTISRWVKRGLIPVLLRTSKELYIKDSVIREIAEQYKQNPGQGKKTIQSAS